MIRNRTIPILLSLALSVPISAGNMKLPPITERTLDNGLNVIIVENHELPIVSLEMVISSGSLFDPADKSGLAGFTASLLRNGTKTRKATEIADQIDYVGGSLDCQADRDAVYITANTLLKHFDAILDIMSDVILNPAFDDEEIERYRRQTINGIIESKDDPSLVCADNFNKLLFGDHPYGHPVNGTIESVESITKKDIAAYYSEYFLPNNSFLVVAGDITPDGVMAAITGAFGQWKKGIIENLKLSTPPAPEGRSILLIDKPDATQTNIRFGGFGITRESDYYYSFQVMNYVLGAGVSFINRLMTEVRDKGGLTYDIRTINEFNRLPGAFYCRTFTENDSTLKAIDAAMKVMEDLAENGISDEEYKNAIGFYTGYYPVSLETPSDIAHEIIRIRLSGLPVSYITDFTENIQKVSKDDIRRIAGLLIDTDNMVMCVVSRAADVEEDLKKLGHVTVKSIDDL